MSEYRVTYLCDNGFDGEVIVFAVNRIIAFEVFQTLEIPNVISVDIVRI